MRFSWLLLFVLVGLVPTDSFAQFDARNIDQFLASGEFGPARAAADQLPPDQRDAALARIARDQAAAGIRAGASKTMSLICSEQTRQSTADSLRSTPAAGSRGGGVIADFDTLIDLVTSTISPDSWLDNGGKGTISGFPTGVLVDATGLVKKMPTVATPTLTSLHRQALTATTSGDHRRSHSLRKVSLSRLERAIQERYAVGQSPTDVMLHLAGLRRIQYVFVYPETHDIVIAGPAGDWEADPQGRAVSTEGQQPVLRLEDFIVVLRNSFDDETFGCAIVPSTENLARAQQYLAASSKKSLPPGKSAREDWVKGLRQALGYQAIEVHGVPRNTNVARVMVEADYHMKLVGMGIEPGVAGVSSYLESITLKPGESPEAMGVLRWWFTLGDGAIRTTENKQAFELTGNSVKVLSENEQLTNAGDRVHTGKAEGLNQQFAENFTKHFSELARTYPVYGELRNVFDWAVVVAALKQERAFDQAGWHAHHFRNENAFPVSYTASPEKVMSVANYRLVNGKTLIVGVSGGVEVKPRVKLQSNRYQTNNYGDLEAGLGQAKPGEGQTRWWWD